MPLPKRVVEPILVARDTLPEQFSVPDELEGVANGTLANVIRQLASLSKHAEDTFGELINEGERIVKRAIVLQDKIDRLSIKVTQLDSNVEEVSLQDIHMRKAYKSRSSFDQQVVNRSSMPTAMLETYKLCDKPPPLDKLNPYRDDGKDGLKFYTDTNYFFDLWKAEMLKDTERMMHDRGRKPHKPKAEGAGRHKKRLRQPHNTREDQRQRVVAKGEYIASSSSQYRLAQIAHVSAQQQVDENMEGRPSRPSSIELKKAYLQQDAVYMTQQLNKLSNPPSYQDYTDYPPPLSNNRPSQPPPAPPGSVISQQYSHNGGSLNNSGSNTPTVSVTGTPTRIFRAGSVGRESLPPPPPPPVDGMQTPPHLANGPLPMHPIKLAKLPGTVADTSRHSTPTHQVKPMEVGHNVQDTVDLPPPPPIPGLHAVTDTEIGSPPPPPMLPDNAPPPPPPPPLPISNGITPELSRIPNGDIVIKSETTGKPISPKKNDVDPSGKKSVQFDARSDLLKAIRDGIKLRKVEDIKAKEVERTTPLHDVASILARRVAMEFSDSDSASDSEGDSEAWEEETSA